MADHRDPGPRVSITLPCGSWRIIIHGLIYASVRTRHASFRNGLRGMARTIDSQLPEGHKYNPDNHGLDRTITAVRDTYVEGVIHAQ